MKNWILIAILLVSQVTLASEQISKRKIHQVNVYANYAIVTLATPNFSNTDGCTHSNAKRSVGIDLNAAGGKEQLAAQNIHTQGGFNISKINFNVPAFLIKGCKRFFRVIRR
jgi:hypothetical protein